MSKWLLYLAGFVLIAHGLIHLMGTTVYLHLGDVTGFTYKTTLLDAGMLELLASVFLAYCGLSPPWGLSRRVSEC